MLDKQLSAFIEEGHASYIASRNERLEPNAARVSALKVDEDGQHVTAFVPTVSAGPVLDDLRANGQVAVVLTRPTDDRGCQVKGVFIDARDAAPEERALVVRQWERFRDTLERVGLPRTATDAWIHWPCIAVRLRVNALFDQTPGPGAGAPLR
jgi:hypothetical protein